jgi:hypothetical protein
LFSDISAEERDYREHVFVHTGGDSGKERTLKVLPNEKRGGLKVVAFDRSPFKLFTLRFSNKLVQAPSCERPKLT